jgi:hypothetical protein
MNWIYRLLSIDFKKYVVYGGYMFIALLVGENQPFTRVPMYESLPNWAYVFYLKDDKGQTVFLKLKSIERLSVESLSHMFSSYCNEKKLHYGHGQESDTTLALAGKFLMQEIDKKWPADKVKPTKLYLIQKRIYFNEQGIMAEQDKQIAESND